MKGFVILTQLVFALVTLAYGQVSQREVISPAGRQDATGEVVIEWTLGEWKVASLESKGLLYTEGFHQPDPVAWQNAKVESLDGLVIECAPNPVTRALTVSARAGSDYMLKVNLYDLSGQRALLSRDMLSNGAAFIDLSAFAAGIYVISVTDESGNPLQSFKINKLN